MTTAQRATRPHGSRETAGVASAIGQRLDVDPVVVRLLLCLTVLVLGDGVAWLRWVTGVHW